ncbi:hypothetical protein RFI_07322, partial [Reticulomyxa filosa]
MDNFVLLANRYTFFKRAQYFSSKFAAFFIKVELGNHLLLKFFSVEKVLDGGIKYIVRDGLLLKKKKKKKLDSLPLESWESEHVCAWLTYSNDGKLKTLAPLFHKNCIPGMVLSEVDAEMLEKKLGVKELGTRLCFEKFRDELIAEKTQHVNKKKEQEEAERQQQQQQQQQAMEEAGKKGEKEKAHMQIQLGANNEQTKSTDGE